MKISKNIFKSLSVEVLLRLLLLISIASIPVLYQFNWSGFGEDSSKSKSIEKTVKDGKIINIKETETEHFQSGKTLWDWLGLAGTLAIPVVLFQFQASEQRRAEKRAKVEKEQAEELAKVEKQQAEQREKVEKDIAEDNLREEVFQAYIDRMSEILINQRNRSELFCDTNTTSERTNTDNSMRDVARVRTVTILRRLENDTERQNRILDFLRDTELLQFLLKTANLRSVNLCNVNLSGANLTGANLSDSNLNNTILSNTNLTNANLDNANLANANLTNSNLDNANLTNANLTNANLEISSIENTKFINADFTNAILIGARTWDEEKDFSRHYQETYEPVFNIEEYEEEKSCMTDFLGAILTNADLEYANLSVTINLTVEQLKKAINWNKATYKSNLSKQLGLLKSLQTIKSEGEDIKKLIGYRVEVRNYIDEEIKSGEITGFSKSNRRVIVKASNGGQLDKLDLSDVYIYIT